jgi:hypothetical protein
MPGRTGLTSGPDACTPTRTQPSPPLARIAHVEARHKGGERARALIGLAPADDDTAFGDIGLSFLCAGKDRAQRSKRCVAAPCSWPGSILAGTSGGRQSAVGESARERSR